MDLVIKPRGWACWRGRDMRCAVGRSGIGGPKRESDGLTPTGRYALRNAYFRPDRQPRPDTILECAPIAQNDGWCNAPGDPAYNHAVRLPYPASTESLWREDQCYDLLAVIGYNDDPVIDGLGSGIFLHLARGAYEPTEGCVALSTQDFLSVLAQWRAKDRIIIEPA